LFGRRADLVGQQLDSRLSACQVLKNPIDHQCRKYRGQTPGGLAGRVLDFRVDVEYGDNHKSHGGKDMLGYETLEALRHGFFMTRQPAFGALDNKYTPT
jgi:hypothetical protein